MAFEFKLPDIGEGLAEATVVRWLVAEGEPVANDEPVVELETDKAVVEIPSPRAGIVLHHAAPEGAVVAVDHLLVVIGDEGETWQGGESGEPEPQARPAQAAPIVGTLDDDGGPRIQALPVVRKLAAQLGVDLAALNGSGPGGRITREDVQSAASGVGDSAPPPSGSTEGERVRMSPTRLAIARNLTRSWQEIPHVTTFEYADPTSLLESRAPGVPLEAVLIERVIPVLRDFPEFNSTLDGDELVLHRRYDIGFAVDTKEGLMVAVVKGADAMTSGQLGEEVARLAEAARDRTATIDELRGPTFTVSNIGAVGGHFGTPIIPYGTTAILSVGRAEAEPVVREGRVTVGRRFPLSLSYDHRVIDGAYGRRFMSAVIDAIEGAAHE